MSKRMKRFALALLISLALVAGVYTTVLASHGVSYGSLHVTAGLMPDYSHARTAAVSLNAYYSDLQTPAQFHDCGDGNSAFDPND